MIKAGTQTSALYKTIPAPLATYIHSLTATDYCCTNVLPIKALTNA